MFLRSKKRRRSPVARSMLSTSTTEPKTRKKATAVSGSKSTFGDLQAHPTQKSSKSSEVARKACHGPQDGGTRPSIGGSRKAMLKSASTVLIGKIATCSKPPFLEGNPLRLLTVGLVERHRNDEILLDFDSSRTPSLRTLWSLLSLWGLRPRFVCDTRTRRGWHRIIGLSKALPPAERIAAQCCLGSDLKREALNLMRVLSFCRTPPNCFALSRWNILFERKLHRT
jgi:hypothetical protein